MVRLNFSISDQLSWDLTEIADAHYEGNRTEVLRKAIALLKVAHQARAKGKHLGLTDSPEKLDTLLVGIF
jgi:hypothetical protein